MTEWQKVKIGDICRSVSHTYDRNDRQVVLVNTSDVLDGKILNHYLVDNTNLKGQFKKTFVQDDILYSEIRPAKNDATALLFPMDRLFEQYIAKEMQSVVEKEWTLIPQSKGKYLFDGNHFSLRPDILLENKNDIDGKGNSKKIIIDTKWKRLVPDSSKHYGISQADMYQMYAYHTRLKHVEGVVVMYPYYEGMKEEKIPGYFVKEMDIQIHIVFFDLIKYIKCKKFKECIVGLTQLNVYEGRN